jgi:hypothetical protein
MNIINTCAKYTGDSSTEKGLRTMRFEIPGTGKSLITPIFVLPSRAAKDSCAPGTFEEGSTILISGRLYPNQEDKKMYVVPTQPLQVVNSGILLNHIHLAGGVGFIGEQRNPEVFNFGLMCQAMKLAALNHDWQDSLGFRIESWNDDADRMKKFLFVGRQMSLGGALKFECWTSKDGTKNSSYKVRVKSAQYSFFGKNKKSDVTEGKSPEVFESPHQQAIAKPAVDIKDPVDDKIPF